MLVGLRRSLAAYLGFSINMQAAKQEVRTVDQLSTS
jgi:hypothetical protein